MVRTGWGWEGWGRGDCGRGGGVRVRRGGDMVE